MVSRELKTGDKIVITGPTTGREELVVANMHVNGKPADVAQKGDRVTIHVPFRVRLSDKLFKLLQE